VSERDDRPDDQEELYEEVAPRSIFAATWFRVLLVVIVLGVIGAVAVPYVLDWMNPPPPSRTAVTTKPPAPAPAAPDKTTAERADKKDGTMIPAPAPAPAVPAKPAPGKPEAKSPAIQAKPVEPKASSAPAKATPPAKDSEAAKPATTPQRAAVKAPATTAAAGGVYWVQVGAFKDEEAAKRLVAKLRAENFKAEQSSTRPGGASEAPAKPAAPSGADQYDVYVSGLPAAEISKRLAAKGLAAEPSGGGVVVKPSLPLRDAVALSKDLAIEGFKVQVRRAGGAAPAASASSAPPAGSGETLHRVRVGAFADRATAQAALKELEAKGYKAFIARGGGETSP
jgi:cell division septation protein DedD